METPAMALALFRENAVLNGDGAEHHLPIVVVIHHLLLLFPHLLLLQGEEALVEMEIPATVSVLFQENVVLNGDGAVRPRNIAIIHHLPLLLLLLHLHLREEVPVETGTLAMVSVQFRENAVLDGDGVARPGTIAIKVFI